MDQINPQLLANLLRNQSNMPQTPQNQIGNQMLPPNFVPPNVNQFPKLRQGDEELLKQYGITPEEYFNFQAQIR
jgi:hypothetical protein